MAFLFKTTFRHLGGYSATNSITRALFLKLIMTCFWKLNVHWNQFVLANKSYDLHTENDAIAIYKSGRNVYLTQIQMQLHYTRRSLCKYFTCTWFARELWLSLSWCTCTIWWKFCCKRITKNRGILFQASLILFNYKGHQLPWLLCSFSWLTLLKLCNSEFCMISFFEFFELSFQHECALRFLCGIQQIPSHTPVFCPLKKREC